MIETMNACLNLNNIYIVFKEEEEKQSDLNLIN